MDLTPLHVESARRRIKDRGLEDEVSVRLGDYHDLSDYEDFDVVYVMETFEHADDPMKVSHNFYRVLKPSSVIAIHAAYHTQKSELLQQALRLSHCPNVLPQGSLEDMIRRAGFEIITTEDLTDQLLPPWRLFASLGAIPYAVLRTLGLQHRFSNLCSGMEVYLHSGEGGYVSVKAMKPRREMEGEDSRR